MPLIADAALEFGERDPDPDGKPRLEVNGRSKRAAVILPASSRMIDDGGVQERVRLIRPATGETMARAELDASNWGRANEAQWRRVWDAEIAGLPSHRESPSGSPPGSCGRSGTACRPRTCVYAASRRMTVSRSSGPRSLANGWRLARRRLMGANRVEIEGPADTDMDALKCMGCTVEIVSFRARIIAPNPDAMERILDRWRLAA